MNKPICPICKRALITKYIDHDGSKIRGTICFRCADLVPPYITIEILESAIEYLKKSEK